MNTRAERDPRTCANSKHFWILLLPITWICSITIARIAPLLNTSVLSPNTLKEVFLGPAYKECAPEPHEQAAYVLWVLLPVALLLVSTFALRLARGFSGNRATVMLGSALALLSQLVLVGVGLRGLLFDQEVGFRQFYSNIPAIVVLIPVVATFGLWQTGTSAAFKQNWALVAPHLERQRWLPWLIAAAWVALWSSTGLFTEAEMRQLPPTVTYHLPFTMGEYLAAANGLTNTVDFFGQYQNLLPVALGPLFAWMGPGVLQFTLVMTAMTFVGMLCLYSVLCRVTRSDYTALLLFLPFVAISFIHNKETPPYFDNSFNYYAVGPIRYFGTFVLARVSLWYVELPTWRRLLLTAGVATLTAVNNLDFGIPAFCGTLACTTLFPPRRHPWPAASRMAISVLGFLGAGLGAIVLTTILFRLRAGQWPVPDSLVSYQRIFAAYGFGMIPVPKVGLYQTFFLLLILPVLRLLYDVFSMPTFEFSKQLRVSHGTLLYAGISGFGPFTYFMGRSHPLVLGAVHCAVGYMLSLLVYRYGSELARLFRQGKSLQTRFLVIPGTAVIGLFLLTIPNALLAPDPVKTVERLRRPMDASHRRFEKELPLVTEHVTPGEKTVIISANAHWLAMLAGVKNLYPFAHSGSLMLREQLEPVLAAIQQIPSEEPYVFGTPPKELVNEMAKLGFRRVDGSGSFGVWKRTRELASRVDN